MGKKTLKEAAVVLTRPTKIPVVEETSVALWKNLPRLIGFKPTVSAFAVKNNINKIIRNEREMKILLPQYLLEKIQKQPTFWPRFEKSFRLQISEIKRLSAAIKKINLKDKKAAALIIKKFHKVYESAWVGGIVLFWLPKIADQMQQKRIEGFAVIKKALGLRKETEKLLTWQIEFYQQVLEKIAEKEKISPDLLDNLKFAEIIRYFDKGLLPPRNVLAERFKGGWISLNNHFYLLKGHPIKKFLEKKGFRLIEPTVGAAQKTIKGQIAFQGQAKGRVRLMFHPREIYKFKAGEVLVAAMTTPQYLPAMKKAAAIITDEGGITCHAAIVSREMKKPCIIGTKIATKVLKDGNLVEVDANRGIVKIIKK